MVKNPIYTDDSPVYEDIHDRCRSQQLMRLASNSSHSHLDTPNNCMPSPTQSSHSHAMPSPQCFINNAPGSPYSNGAFNWHYAEARPPPPETFDAIHANVQMEARLAGQTNLQLQPNTPGEESYMTMSSVPKKNAKLENTHEPRHAVDKHGNQYIEC